MVFSALANKLVSAQIQLCLPWAFSLVRPEIKEEALPSLWAKVTLRGPCVSGHVVHRLDFQNSFVGFHMARDERRPLATCGRLAVGRFAAKQGSLRSPRVRLVASLSTVGLVYVTEIHWPRRPGETPYITDDNRAGGARPWDFHCCLSASRLLRNLPLQPESYDDRHSNMTTERDK